MPEFQVGRSTLFRWSLPLCPKRPPATVCHPFRDGPRRFALCLGLAGIILLGCPGQKAWAGTLTGSFAPISTGSNVNLTVSGKLDWAHWGLYTMTSVNRKSCAARVISDFTLVGDI